MAISITVEYVPATDTKPTRLKVKGVGMKAKFYSLTHSVESGQEQAELAAYSYAKEMYAPKVMLVGGVLDSGVYVFTNLWQNQHVLDRINWAGTLPPVPVHAYSKGTDD